MLIQHSTGSSKRDPFVRYMKYTCSSLQVGASHVRIDQSLFAPINADFLKRALLFCSSYRLNPPSHHILLLCSPLQTS